MRRWLYAFSFVVVVAFIAFDYEYCFNNERTPAGCVGYLVQYAAIGKSQFYGLQTGPCSSGKTLFLKVQNIRVALNSNSTVFFWGSDAISKDNLKIELVVNLVWKVRSDRVKDFVDRYSDLSYDDDSQIELAYGKFLQGPLRTYAYDEIRSLNCLEIKDKLIPLSEALLKRMQAFTADTPFEVIGVLVNNIQYPKEVNTSLIG